ncbi:hypothetical protein DW1_0338 [Proteiniborus sp. DW1]|uniref:DUF5317 domain-containing protein n=1 Tax=Proteiniborus sp. DW1 TaxID=1889883 RepID=UPI00092DFBE9|nr:DUF5317 domain-containing protein [Proteiniborus sp. DW1]SCG81958.1 hypothetical protein DW1_0338 [Proteiniborus sp. DW1]
MLIESMVLAILFGKIRGGKVSRLSNLEFKRVWVFVLALIIQVGVILFAVNGNEFALKYIREINAISYVLLFAGFVINAKQRVLITMLLGMLMNVLVMFSNGWQTPISIDGLTLAGYEELAKLTLSGKLAFYTPLSETTKYGFLSKIITIPPPYFFPQVLSIGDVFIALGLFTFVQSIMTNDGFGKSGVVRFNYKSKI